MLHRHVGIFEGLGNAIYSAKNWHNLILKEKPSKFGFIYINVCHLGVNVSEKALNKTCQCLLWAEEKEYDMDSAQ